MHRVFIEPSQVDEKDHRVIIRGDEVNHIKNVLRMKPGEELDACESVSRRLYRCMIEDYAPGEVICRLCFIKEADTELSSGIYLFQGLPKADKLELIVQKAVELGVREIIPVSTMRSVVRLDEKKSEKKRVRWQAIAEGAASQSRRAYVPQVKDTMDFAAAVEYCRSVAVKSFIPYELCEEKGMEHTRMMLSQIAPGEAVGVFIGPEGGFDESEISLAEGAGIIPVTMGRRILRTETAAITILSWLMYLRE